MSDSSEVENSVKSNNDVENDNHHKNENNNATNLPIVFTGRVNVLFPYNTIMQLKQIPADIPFEQLLRLIAHQCHDHIKNIKLSFNKRTVSKYRTPREIFKDISEAHDLKCIIKNPALTKKINLGVRKLPITEFISIDAYIYKGSDVDADNEPDILDVQIGAEHRNKKRNLIEIKWVPEGFHKPFLGGYRHKLDERVFHNASAQVMSKRIRPHRNLHFSRETQTHKMCHAEQNTLEEASTAMTKVGFYYTNSSDRLVRPMHYETADEYSDRILSNVIIIQRHVRRWLAKRKVDRLRKLRDDYYAWVAAKEEVDTAEIESRFDRDYERRLHPKNRADFDRLFNALEQWRKEETEKISVASTTLAERKAALGVLIDRESELITAISQHQIEISKNARIRKEEIMMETAATTKRWTATHDMEAVEKDIPEILRARELLTMYEVLKSNCLSDGERLDILLTVKKTVGEYPSRLCCDIIGLLERESELILRHVRASRLVGLRTRITNRFIQFCKNTEYNPGIANFLPVPNRKIPNSRAKMWDDTHCCKSCSRYLRTREFPSGALATSLNPCKFCRRQNNRGRARIDYEPYRLILKFLREKEAELLIEAIESEEARRAKEALYYLDKAEAMRDNKGKSYQIPDIKDDSENPLTESQIDRQTNKLELLINVEDVYFLVKEIWENRSVLSGSSELADLTLCRWMVEEPWAPWNTILVTKKEADLHYQLKSIKLESLYTEAMSRRVRQRLIMAKNVFARLCPTGDILTTERKQIRDSARHPVATDKWFSDNRRPLPGDGTPLYITTLEDRHKPTVQPPEILLPIIKGDKRLADYGVTSLKQITTKWIQLKTN